ncbi:MAG: tetratricopeptide repeat protein, partial [Deltaproteobacteria bacterium]|nr:tetratricopeptide repeat protein [Deltaproteobacteria bacterium]
RVGYEKCELYGAYGGDRVFESLPLFSGRQTLEGIHYASSQAARFMAFLQTAYSKDVKTPRSYVLSRLNPQALPAYFDLYNMSQLILMTDKGRAAIATSPCFEKEASFGDIAIYRYRDCDGRYVDVPKMLPILFRGKDWPEDFVRWYKAGDHLEQLMIPEGYVKDEADRRVFHKSVGSLQGLPPLAGEPLDRSDLRIEARLEHLRISFTTNRVGVPHLVKVSYYPNWKVNGARGVYPVSPHLMMVVPRETEVVLSYGRTCWDWLGTGITWATVLLLAAWVSSSAIASLLRLPSRPEGTKASRRAALFLQVRKSLGGLGHAVLPQALDRAAEKVRPFLLWLVLGAAAFLIVGGAAARNEPVRIYVRGYGEWKTGMDLLQAKKPALARPRFEKAIEVMAPLVEDRAGHDHQDVIHCMLFTAQCREQLGESGSAEKIYRTILEEYPYSRFVAEAYVKIGRLRRQGRDRLLGQGIGRLKAGDESGKLLLEKSLDLSRQALHLFETALREDPYSVWADYARQDIRQEKEWARRVEGQMKGGSKQ